MEIKELILIYFTFLSQKIQTGNCNEGGLGVDQSQLGLVYISDLDELEFRLKELNFNVSSQIAPTRTFLPRNLANINETEVTEQKSTDTAEEDLQFLVDKFPVPEVNAMYSFDQIAVKILLNFISAPENSDTLSQQHLELIKKYIYEWITIIHEPLDEKDANKMNEKLGTQYSHIPRALGFPDIVLRIVIRVQRDLRYILDFSEDFQWKQKVVEKVYEVEAETGIDSLKIVELETAANSIAILSKTYNLHPFELYPHANLDKNMTLVSFTTAAAFSIYRQSFAVALEWIRAAKKLLSRKFTKVWEEIRSENGYLQKLFPREEFFCDEVQHIRDNYEIRKKNNVRSEMEKLQNIITFDKKPMHSDSGSQNFQYFKEKSDILYVDIFYNCTSIIHDQYWNIDRYGNYHGLFPKLLSQESLDIQASKEAKENQLRGFQADKEGQNIFVRQDRLCRGIKTRLSRYTCRLDSRNSSWLLLMPVKVEELNSNPEVLIFHSVIAEKKIEEFQQLALPIGAISKTMSASEFASERDSSGIRKSYVSWLHEQTSENIQILNHLVGALTGYIATNEFGGAESLQMNSYIAGGFYVPHDDAFDVFKEFYDADDKLKREAVSEHHSDGDRIATFMIYMNAEILGGRTVYPRLMLSAEPEKGSVLFWNNLHLNGSINELALHAGCPVLSGIKWVANKWIRSNSQMFRKPCALNKNM